MNENEINVEETILDIIAIKFNVATDALSNDKTLLDFGADSLDVIEIEMEIENRLGFKNGDFFKEELCVNITIGEILKKARNVYGKMTPV